MSRLLEAPFPLVPFLFPSCAMGFGYLALRGNGKGAASNGTDEMMAHFRQEI